MFRAALLSPVVTCGLLVSAATCGLANAAQADDWGRSAVGVAKRSDGAVAVVTVWCMGRRQENLQIAGFNGEIGDSVYAAAGQSDTPATVHTIGRGDGHLVPLRSKAIPTSERLIAYNAGERRDLLGAHVYPSSVAVFTADRLPVSDAPLPTELLAGDHQRTSLDELVAHKCDAADPLSAG